MNAALNLLTAVLSLIRVYGWNTDKPTIRLPDGVPDSLGPCVDRSFQAFAIEQGSLIQYATYNGDVNSPNTYSLNMFRAITSKTGGELLIRIGGTSADYAPLVLDQEEPVLPAAHLIQNQDSIVASTTLGPSYWDYAASVPDARYIVQLPLVFSNISETLLWATTSWRALRGRVEAIELGNEANHYLKDGPKGSEGFQHELTNQTYAQRFADYADAVTESLDLPRDKKIYQVLDTGSAGGAPGNIVFDVPQVYDAGVDRPGMIKQAAWHYYQHTIVAQEEVPRWLMNHTDIVVRLEEFRPIIKYLNDEQGGTPFILSEVGNSLNPLQNFSVQAILGTALWQVDYELYAASMGVFRVHNQQIMHAGYNLWLPEDSDGRSAQTYSNFYGRIAVADFLGNTGGNTRVSPLSLDGTAGTGSVVGYGAWVDGVLVRIALVNFDLWDSPESPFNPNSTETRCPDCAASSVARPTVDIELKDLPSWVKVIEARHLDADSGAHADGPEISYGGTQWTKESDGLPVRFKNDTMWIDVDRGCATVPIQSSSALVLHLHY